MNLEEQIGAIDAQVDRLGELVRLAQAAAERAEAERARALEARQAYEALQTAHATATATAEAEAASAAANAAAAPADEKPTLRVARPSHNALTLSIGEQTVTLHPEQIGQLIE